MKFKKLIQLLAIASLTLGNLTAMAEPTNTQKPTTTAGSPASDAVRNKAIGDAFLANNKKKPGVVTLSDGLQYKVLTEGKGIKPTESDLVTVDYTGSLIDGTEFDSSYKHGKPMTFQLGQVIPGWVEALKLMPAGSTWEIYIPSHLAYGEQGAPPVIGPNQTLIFKVSLLDVKKS